jgi:hypothetical protein
MRFIQGLALSVLFLVSHAWASSGVWQCETNVVKVTAANNDPAKIYTCVEDLIHEKNIKSSLSTLECLKEYQVSVKSDLYNSNLTKNDLMFLAFNLAIDEQYAARVGTFGTKSLAILLSTGREMSVGTDIQSHYQNKRTPIVSRKALHNYLGDFSYLIDVSCRLQ